MVMGSLLKVWEVEVPDSNSTMRSAWKIILCSQIMLTSVLNGTGCTTMAHLDLLLLQAQAKWVEYHYGHAQVEDANSNHPTLPIFLFIKKKSMLNNGIYLLILVILFTNRNGLVLAKYGEKEEKEKKNK